MYCFVLSNTLRSLTIGVIILQVKNIFGKGSNEIKHRHPLIYTVVTFPETLLYTKIVQKNSLCLYVEVQKRHRGTIRLCCMISRASVGSSKPEVLDYLRLDWGCKIYFLGGSPTVLISFQTLTKSWGNHFRRKKVSFGSGFQRFQFVVSWPVALRGWGDAEHHVWWAELLTSCCTRSAHMCPVGVPIPPLGGTHHWPSSH